MYKLEFLPAAQQDMVEIVRYISIELCNPTAAERLAKELIAAADGIQAFPYANPQYLPLRPLTYEYRKLLVRNYLLFYRVDEKNKQVTVTRVLYARRDYNRLSVGSQ